MKTAEVKVWQGPDGGSLVVLIRRPYRLDKFYRNPSPRHIKALARLFYDLAGEGMAEIRPLISPIVGWVATVK